VLVLCLCGILSFLDFSLWMFSLYAPCGHKNWFNKLSYLSYLILMYFPAIYLHLYINSHGGPACMYTIYIHTVHKPFNKGRFHVKLTFGTTFGKNPTVNQINTDASQYFLLPSTNRYVFPETMSIRYRFLIKARQKASSLHVRTSSKEDAALFEFPQSFMNFEFNLHYNTYWSKV
jgi:hypothetical protein